MVIRTNICQVKILKYIGFSVYYGTLLLWSLVPVGIGHPSDAVYRSDRQYEDLLVLILVYKRSLYLHLPEVVLGANIRIFGYG